MAIAVLAVMSLSFILPSHLALGPGWIVPAVEGLLLVALIVADPGRIDRRTVFIRRASIALVGFIVLVAMLYTGVLIYDLVTNASETQSAEALLVAGAKIWLGNNIAFALLYWELDSGGPAERAQRMRQYTDFAFPQQLSPDLSPPGWRPRFLDYLYVAFTNANAFSPTDTMPMTHWAKFAMAVQALISFVIIGLVLARAVNAFT